MSRFLALLSANIKMTLRNTQAIFWMFLFPLIMMSLFGIVFGGGQAKPKVAVVRLDNSPLAVSVNRAFGKVKVVRRYDEDNESVAVKRLKSGRYDAVLVLRQGFASGLPRVPAKVDLYYDPASTFASQVARGTVTSVLGEINRGISKAPVLLTAKSHSVRQQNLRYIDFLVPGIVAMTLMNSALFGLGGTIVNYRERGILRRLKVTPQPLTQFVAAQVGNQVFFSIIRALLLILAARLLFGVHVLGNYLALMVVIIVGSLCFVTVAFAIASFAKNREISDTLSNIISMPMMFLGGVFFPVDNAPQWIKPVIRVLPLKYLADAMRDIMIKGNALATVRGELWVLLGVTGFFFLLSLRLWRWE